MPRWHHRAIQVLAQFSWSVLFNCGIGNGGVRDILVMQETFLGRAVQRAEETIRVSLRHVQTIVILVRVD